MVLDHVLQRPGGVVVGRPAFQGERLVPDDVHPLDVLVVPEGLEEPVGEAQDHDLLDERVRKEVVHAKDGRGREMLPEKTVEADGRLQTIAKRLLDCDDALRGEARPGDSQEGGFEQVRSQGQVDKSRPIVTLQRRGDLLRRTDVRPAVLDGPYEAVPYPRVDLGSVLFQSCRDLPAERFGLYSPDAPVRGRPSLEGPCRPP